MKKILMVFGTRPEAIKMAPLLKELQARPDTFDIKLCATAQHRQILDQIIDNFDMVPDYDLNIMTAGQDLYDITRKVLAGMKPILNDYAPDLVLVHGDTTTTFAASLAAFYEKIPVGHVEAGLRTNDPYLPYPEEINRQLTSRIATYHFAPTVLNKENLLKENISSENIGITGNTVIDALFMTLNRIRRRPSLEKKLLAQIDRAGYPFGKRGGDRRIVLVTGHRRENFGKGFSDICGALKQIALAYPDVDIVYPVHLNPNVKQPVSRLLSEIENIFLIAPLDYTAFVFLMSRAYLVLTDSGGIQEEAPALGKPTLVMRTITERPEAVDAGSVRLLGTDQANIFSRVKCLLEDDRAYQRMATAANPYGDGTAAYQIAEFLTRRLQA